MLSYEESILAIMVIVFMTHPLNNLTIMMVATLNTFKSFIIICLEPNS